jgi:GT2 family glycosyltransferase
MLDKLPPAPEGRMGWPWEANIPQRSGAPASGGVWPRLTVITPSLNQVSFLEETIRSVLLQGYPNLEYIIVDGGSRDGSVEIIRKYESWLAWWVSEPDAGQSDAINKALARATGSVIAWINSDDAYLPDVFAERLLAFADDPSLVLVYGDVVRVDETGKRLTPWKPRPVTLTSMLMEGNQIPQQSTFIRAAAFKSLGGLDRSMHFAMDYALWLQLFRIGNTKYIPGTVANFRKHRASKGLVSGHAFLLEEIRWLSNWADLKDVLSASDRDEMFRRKELTAALYAIFEGNQTDAVAHLETALKEDRFPYGDAESLATWIVQFGGMGGASMVDAWEHFETFERALFQNGSTPARRFLQKRLAYHFHFIWSARTAKTGDLAASRGHVFQCLRYDLRCLRNRLFWMTIVHAFLPPAFISWIQRLRGRSG